MKNTEFARVQIQVSQQETEEKLSKTAKTQQEKDWLKRLFPAAINAIETIYTRETIHKLARELRAIEENLPEKTVTESNRFLNLLLAEWALLDGDVERLIMFLEAANFELIAKGEAFTFNPRGGTKKRAGALRKALCSISDRLQKKNPENRLPTAPEIYDYILSRAEQDLFECCGVHFFPSENVAGEICYALPQDREDQKTRLPRKTLEGHITKIRKEKKLARKILPDASIK